jgi:prevent-host-death family protein
MKKVMVSQLKAHLSEHLAAVRGGETIIVCDRSVPIARIVPLDDPSDDFDVEPAKESWPPDFAGIERVELKGEVDVVAILREDRDHR